MFTEPPARLLRKYTLGQACRLAQGGCCQCSHFLARPEAVRSQKEASCSGVSARPPWRPRSAYSQQKLVVQLNQTGYTGEQLAKAVLVTKEDATCSNRLDRPSNTRRAGPDSCSAAPLLS